MGLLPKIRAAMPPTGDHPTRHLAVLALMAGLALACGGGSGSTGGGDKPKPASEPSVVSPDSLAVNVEGLPKEGPPADVTVTGPSGYHQQLSGSQNPDPTWHRGYTPSPPPP